MGPLLGIPWNFADFIEIPMKPDWIPTGIQWDTTVETTLLGQRRQKLFRFR